MSGINTNESPQESIKDCFYPNCKNKVECVCLCDFTCMCINHLKQHSLIQRTHKYCEVNQCEMPQSKAFVLESLFEFINYAQILQKKVLSESNMLIKEIINVSTSIISKIRQFEIQITSYFEFLSSNRVPNSFAEDYLHTISSKELPILQHELNATWKQPVINSLSRKILPMISNLFPLENLGLPMKLKENKYLYFFVEATDILVSFNAKRKNVQNIKLSLKSNKGNSATLCLLPKNQIFYGGGFMNNKTLNEYFILDEYQGKLITVVTGRPRKQGGSCFIYPYVYVFGGCEGDRAMKFCDKFNIQTYKWEPFPALPQDSDTTVTTFEGKIFLSGRLMTCVYLFDHINGWYINVLRNLPVGNKFLFSGNGRIYVLCTNALYRSELFNPWKWEFVKDTNNFLGKYWIAASVRYRESLYFTTGHYLLFTGDWPKAKIFNFETLELTEIV